MRRKQLDIHRTKPAPRHAQMRPLSLLGISPRANRQTEEAMIRTITATVTDMSNQVGALACGPRLQFYVHTFKLDTQNPKNRAEICGAVFTWSLRTDPAGIDHVERRPLTPAAPPAQDSCEVEAWPILSRRPLTPAAPPAPTRASVFFETLPTGHPDSWTFAQLAACQFRFDMPELLIPATPGKSIPPTSYTHLATNPPCQPEPAPAAS